MGNGLLSRRKEGTPQGSPLSPLLSNVILHELDAKLEERGHRFVRYADDCSIYLGSKKSAERVMSNISSYLEECLKLKVNREKSKVNKPTDSSLLGFSFYKKKGWQLRLSSGSVKKVKEKIRFYTQRKHSVSLSNRLGKLDEVIRGWVNYFSIATGKRVFEELDRMVRRRLRVILWKEWKNASNRTRNLIKLGISKSQSYQWSQSRKSYCRTANSKILMISLNNAYFSKMNYVGFEKYYYWKTKHQMKLF